MKREKQEASAAAAPNAARAAHSRAFDDNMKRIETLYSLHDPAQVKDFLTHHPQLVELLVEAYAHIEEAFGDHPQVWLEVFINPDDPEDEELFGLVVTDMPVEEALNTLHHFDEVWFLNKIRQADGKLNFDITFS